MARPQKRGVDYFPFDVDFFEDDKIFDVINEYGPLGEVIYIRLLCLIYRNGYFYQFESLDKLSAMLIKSIGNRWVRDKKTVSQVIPFLAKCNLFSPELMRENVLTSESIQRRYQKATERRQSNIVLKYWLIDNEGNALINVPKNLINVDNNGINVDNNSIDVCSGTQSKVKKSIVKDSKVVKTASCEADSDFLSNYPDDFVRAFNDFRDMRKSIKKPLTDRATEMIVRKVMELASDDFNRAIDILDQSTMNCWQGVFELKGVDGNKVKMLNKDIKNAEIEALVLKKRKRFSEEMNREGDVDV